MHAIGPAGAAVLITWMSAASYAVITATLARGLGFSGQLLVTVCVAGLVLEPVLRTLRLGQINLILVALVVADIFLLPNRMRGVATGIAAGIKLTPGIFILYFLLKRDWLAAGRCVLGFAITIAVSAAITRDDTRLYWTKLFYNPNHIGGVAYVDNQSLYGVLVRLTHTQHPPLPVSAGLSLSAVALAGVAAHRRLRTNEQVAAVTCIGIGGLLASPISWSHHWIWLIGAVLVLIERGQYRWAIALGLISYLAPQWFTPYGGLREFRQAWWQIGLCNLMALSGLVFLLLMLRPARSKALPGNSGIGART
jgi:alpha-1,2-mannosyltransferase